MGSEGRGHVPSLVSLTPVWALGPTVGWRIQIQLGSPWFSWLIHQSVGMRQGEYIRLAVLGFGFFSSWLPTHGAFSGLTGRSGSDLPIFLRFSLACSYHLKFSLRYQIPDMTHGSCFLEGTVPDSGDSVAQTVEQIAGFLPDPLRSVQTLLRT